MPDASERERSRPMRKIVCKVGATASITRARSCSPAICPIRLTGSRTKTRPNHSGYEAEATRAVMNGSVGEICDGKGPTPPREVAVMTIPFRRRLRMNADGASARYASPTA